MDNTETIQIPKATLISLAMRELGKRGGTSKTRAKVLAGRKNAAKARAARWANKD